jgi:hypothetical protein
MNKTDPYEMDYAEYCKALDQKTSPKQIWQNAGRIYEYLTELFGMDCTDSGLREWAFLWYSEKTKKDYNDIYDRWLNFFK